MNNREGKMKSRGTRKKNMMTAKINKRLGEKRERN